MGPQKSHLPPLPHPRCRNWSTEKLLSSGITKIPSNTLILSFFPSRGWVQSTHYGNWKHTWVCCFMVVQGHLLTRQTLRQDSERTGRCQCQGHCQGRAGQPSCGHFPLLSSLTRVSGRWKSIFISGLLPADCDSSINALCKLNLTSTVLCRASFSFYRCFLLLGWWIDAATFSKYK